MSSTVALVTGGGRGVGANVARELAREGWRVAVAARSGDEVARVAEEIGGLPLAGDVTRAHDVELWVAETERALGPIDLLFANAGTMLREPEGAWQADADEWWRVFEVNVRGVDLCCRAVIPGMIGRGEGRIVVTASGAAYLPGTPNVAYGASKAAAARYAELLAKQLEPHGVHVFAISPGLVRTAMTESFPDDAPWTPPECAPRLVAALASGRFDRLAGRYLHAEHDPPEALAARLDEIVERDLNAIRLRRDER